MATVFAEDGEVEGVRKQMSVSKAQASRYVSLARERGFIPADES